MAERNKGTVKWFNAGKGFGFIEIDGQKEDIFVHYSGIIADGYKKLNEGDIVEFDIIKGKKGMQAENVIVIQSGTPKDKNSYYRPGRRPSPSRELDEVEEP